MRLPRRVPWKDLSELEQVCGWVYTEENDLDAKRLAVNRLAAWKASVPLPHALESAHAILSVVLEDGTSTMSSSYLLLRMSYASALIRLVNGLVDPLQLGAYARSINSIAQQLGLPTWFVELRHAATHEDLPSLEVLRDAAREAMVWLLHNYFLPTLNPSMPSSAPAHALRPLEPLLKQYKMLMKATTRDATLRVTYRSEITKLMRDIERWIAEAKVASASAVGGVDFGWADPQDEGNSDEEDAREKWALDRLSAVLIQRGMLVPLSRKKRLSPGQTALVLPRSLVLIWSPLLSQLRNLHPSIPLHLVSAIVAQLSRPAAASDANAAFQSETVSLAEDGPKTDRSYDLCLASWAKWLVDDCTSSPSEADEAEDIRDAIIVRIVTVLGPVLTASSSSKAVAALLHALSAERPSLATALSLLSRDSSQISLLPQAWEDGTVMNLMESRLNTLLALSGPNGRRGTEDVAMDESGGAEKGKVLQLPAGWRKLSERDGWRPAPVGMYIDCW
ncbi:Las1-domain-containing protein [Trametes punicea]|nr:Las1-domain-containing protein [Trametes punicea]